MARSQKVIPELQDLADQVGEFIEYWGFKRVHGRVWAHLYLSERPLDSGELLARLGISKALVSMTLKDLLDYDVILSAGRSPRGTDLYQANPDVMDVILNVLRKREKRMLGRVEAACRSVQHLSSREKKENDLSESRCESLASMVGTAQGALEGLLGLSSIELKAWREFAKKN